MNTKKAQKSLQLFCKMIMEDSNEAQALLSIVGLWVNALNAAIDGDKQLLNKTLEECEVRPLMLISSSIIDRLHQLDEKRAAELTKQLVTATGDSYDDAYEFFKDCLKHLSEAKKKAKEKKSEPEFKLTEQNQKLAEQAKETARELIKKPDSGGVCELCGGRGIFEDPQHGQSMACHKCKPESKPEPEPPKPKAKPKSKPKPKTQAKPKKRNKLGFDSVVGSLGQGD